MPTITQDQRRQLMRLLAVSSHRAFRHKWLAMPLQNRASALRQIGATS